MAKLEKSPPVTRETWVQSLGWGDALEKGYPLQSSGLENSMDGIVHWVTKGQTRLSNIFGRGGLC